MKKKKIKIKIDKKDLKQNPRTVIQQKEKVQSDKGKKAYNRKTRLWQSWQASGYGQRKRRN